MLHPELGAKPRVYYIGLPKTFIAGTVYDPEADEIIEDALVTLELVLEDTRATVRTDEFGDFLVDGLPKGTYLVSMEKAGYVKKELGPATVEKGHQPWRYCHGPGAHVASNVPCCLQSVSPEQGGNF